jgi:hypothetical protein
MLPLSAEYPQANDLQHLLLCKENLFTQWHEFSLDSPLPSESCIVRQRTATSVEVWGSDIGNHFLLCYDESQEHFLDVTYLPTDMSHERTYGMG